MAILIFSDDLNIIAAMGDNPNTDNNLTSDELKKKFDAAALLIQAYINNTLVPAVNQNTSDISGKMNRSGGTLEGDLNMGGFKLVGLVTPTADNEAASKGYVDQKIIDVVGFSGEHKDLKGLDVADQHPMLAIIGLEKALSGKAESTHYHSVDDVNEGVFSTDRLPVIPVNKGGTGASDVATARANLGANNASNLNAGTVAIARGGTGATTGSAALKNLLAAGNTILSSYQYGTSLPAAGNKGRIFFKKVSS